MATLEVVTREGRWVYEVDAGQGRFLGAMEVSRYNKRTTHNEPVEVIGFGNKQNVVPISYDYKVGTFDGMSEAEWCRFLNRHEGVTEIRLNGSTVWSLAAELAAEAKAEASEANEAERKAKDEAGEDAEREFVRGWIANHPEVTDVPTIAKQTGSSKALVRAVILDGRQTA